MYRCETRETAGDKPEEGEDDVKSACPFLFWATHVLQWPGQRDATLRGEANPRNPGLSSDCRLQLAYMKSESLVIAGQPYGGEYVPGPCTHRPSHYWSRPSPKPFPQPIINNIDEGRGTPKAGLVTGVKS